MQPLSMLWTASALGATSEDVLCAQGWVQRISRSIRVFHLACRSAREAAHIGALRELSECAHTEFARAPAGVEPDSREREDFAHCLEGLDDTWRRLAQGEVVTTEELIHVTDSLVVQLICHLPDLRAASPGLPGEIEGAHRSNRPGP